MLYSITLFLHIVGTLGMFVAFGLEWTSLFHLRRVTLANEARPWMAVLGWVRRIGPASLATILLSGLYMTATIWGGVEWISVALAAMLLLLPPLGAFNGIRLAAMSRAVAAEGGALSADVRHRLRDPLLLASLHTRTAVALGIVFLMTIKPNMAGSLFTIGAALVLGLTSALPAWRRSRTREMAV